MASLITKGQLIFQNENLNIPQKKVVGGKSEITKKNAKKGGPGLGNRKALKDITNKSSVPQKVPIAKQKIHEEDFNIVEEGFLHDHNKCIEAQEKGDDIYLLDLVLPKSDIALKDESLNNNHAKADFENLLCLSDMEELPMDEFTDWFKPSSPLMSPSCSPKHYYSPPDSPLSWVYQKIKLKLKEDDDI